MGTESDMKKVLIVDDEEDMIWSLQKNLPNDNLQVAIVTASSGEEALSLLEKTKIDLIVTDIRMPGMSGIDLLIEVRKKYSGINVIVMTAFPSSESKAEVLDKGGLRFIEKPFDINVMRDYIRKALWPDAHFEGKMVGIQLFDIVQVSNLSKATNAVRTRGGGYEGVIYFVDGNIIHATCGELSGEEAFFKLMSLPGGKIETFYPEKFPLPSMDTPVCALLLRSTMMTDELGNDVDYLETLNMDPSETNLQDESEPPARLSPDEDEPDLNLEDFNPAEIHKQVEDEMDELKELLTEFTNIPGVNTACLVGRDGFLLHSVTLSGIDAEMIGAIASSGFGASEAMGNQLQKGGMSMTMVEYENGPVMFAPVGQDAFLVIIADKDANLGMIRLKIKKHSRDIEKKAGI